MPIPLVKTPVVAVVPAKDPPKECTMAVDGCPFTISEQDLKAYYAPLGREAIQYVRFPGTHKKKEPGDSFDLKLPDAPMDPDQTISLQVIFRTRKLLDQALGLPPPKIAGQQLSVRRHEPPTKEGARAELQGRQLVAWYAAQKAKAQERGQDTPDTFPRVKWPDSLPAFQRDFTSLLPPSPRTETDSEAFWVRHQVTALAGLPAPPAPVLTAADVTLGDHEAGFRTLLGPSFDRPLALQAQAWPLLLSGRDALLVAESTAGAALAFLLPAILHLKAQTPTAAGEGPVALVIAPDGSLAAQIASQAAKFPGLRTFAARGRLDESAAAGVLKGHDLLVGCAELLVDLVAALCLKLQRVTFLVLCEAQTLALSSEFRAHSQVLMPQLRPDRQIIIISTDHSKAVQKMSAEFLRDPAVVRVANCEGIGSNVTQDVQFYQEAKQLNQRVARLLDRLEMKQPTSRAVVLIRTQKVGWGIHGEIQRTCFNAEEIFWDKSEDHIKHTKRYLEREAHARVVASPETALRAEFQSVDVVVIAQAPETIPEVIKLVALVGRGDRPGSAYVFLGEHDAALAYPFIDFLKALGKEPPKLLLRFAKCYGERMKAAKALAEAKKQRRLQKFTKKHGLSPSGDVEAAWVAIKAKEKRRSKEARKRKKELAAAQMLEAAAEEVDGEWAAEEDPEVAGMLPKKPRQTAAPRPPDPHRGASAD